MKRVPGGQSAATSILRFPVFESRQPTPVMDSLVLNSRVLNSSSARRAGVCLCLLLVLVGGCGNRGDLYLVPDDVDQLLEDDVRRIGEDAEGAAIDDELDNVDDDEKTRGTGGTSRREGGTADAVTERDIGEVPVE